MSLSGLPVVLVRRVRCPCQGRFLWWAPGFLAHLESPDAPRPRSGHWPAGATAAAPCACAPGPGGRGRVGLLCTGLLAALTWTLYAGLLPVSLPESLATVLPSRAPARGSASPGPTTPLARASIGLALRPPQGRCQVRW